MRIKKQEFSASLLIGAPFGSVWEVGGARGAPPLTLVEDGVLIPGVDVTAAEDAMQNDNRGYADAGDAQTLTAEDIAAMKAGGAGGTAVVAALAKSSATFAEKNALTQEKWLRKKTLKHVTRFRVVLPTPVAITEHLLEREPARIAGLRWDALAQLLCLGNVSEGGRVLVLDGVGGLLVGAVAHRMGCRGLVLAPHADSSRLPPTGLASKFNLGRLGGRAGEGGAEEGAAGPAAAPPRFPGGQCTGNDHGGRFLVVGVTFSAVLAAVEGGRGGGALAEATPAAAAAAAPADAAPAAPTVAADTAAGSAPEAPAPPAASSAEAGAAAPASDERSGGLDADAAADTDAVLLPAAAEATAAAADAAASGGGGSRGAFAGFKRRRGGAGERDGGADAGESEADAAAARAARLAHQLPVSSLPAAERARLFLAPGDAADACVIAGGWDPSPLLLRVALPLLRPGAPFAVFSPDLPALAALQLALRARALAVHTQARRGRADRLLPSSSS